MMVRSEAIVGMDSGTGKSPTTQEMTASLRVTFQNKTGAAKG